ncbi:plasmid mobilization protein [Streptomyces sp. NPDC021086]|uniref:plasmid mobilization protein n=2 Tax=unclassified Streptomyces TaxID=2593676 RepID=UPI0037977FF1
MPVPHHEQPISEEEMTGARDSTASCRVRSPYPPAASGAAKVSGAGAPDTAGPGGPTREVAIASPSHTTQQPSPRRRLRQTRLRERRIHPRYSDREFADLQHAAALSGMAIGGYVAEASLAAARAEDPTSAVADYRSMVKALMAANRQLGGVGNNLNQLAWHLNKDGPWP